MSEEIISNKHETDWEKFDAMTDEDIDFSDCPEVTSQQFKKAVVRQGLSEHGRKAQVTLRIDNDVLDWFKSQGDDYQAYISNLLRDYVEARQ